MQKPLRLFAESVLFQQKPDVFVEKSDWFMKKYRFPLVKLTLFANTAFGRKNFEKLLSDGNATVVESMLSFTSVWEAQTVRGVADSDVEGLNCERGCRFYRVAAQLA